MNFEAHTDEQLINLVLGGERDALGELYDRHGKAVYGFVLHLLRDHAKAEEVTQEIFVNVWRKANSFRQERGAFSTWIMTMAHHKAIDELRRSQRQHAVMEEMMRQVSANAGAAQETPMEWAQKAETAEAVRKALELLPIEQREVIVLSYYKGLSQSEIAAALQQPLGTVKTRIRLAMQKLRTSFGTLQEPL